MSGKEEKLESELTVSQQFTIVQPEQEAATFIPKSDWERLKKKCERIKSSGSVYNSLGFAFIGISGSALLAALTLPSVAGSLKTICWSVFAVSFIVAILSLYFSREQRKQLTASKDEVLDEMEHLENRYKGKSNS